MATAHQKFSREAAFVLATEALRDAAMVAEDDICSGRTPEFGLVEEALRSYCRDPSDAAREELLRATAEYRVVRRSMALARWRGHPEPDSTH